MGVDHPETLSYQADINLSIIINLASFNILNYIAAVLGEHLTV